jgi:hypothetical protein
LGIWKCTFRKQKELRYIHLTLNLKSDTLTLVNPSKRIDIQDGGKEEVLLFGKSGLPDSG